MVDSIIHYIRNLVFPSDNRKRRATADDYEVHPKIRRVGSIPMSNSAGDDWHSTSSSNGVKHRSGIPIGSKFKPSWSKENETVVIDDDDDILDNTKNKERWLDALKTRKTNLTSTPNYCPQTSKRFTMNSNKDDDVTFLKYIQSPEEKRISAKKEGFDYIKPYFRGTHEATNGNNHDFVSPLVGNVKDMKTKLTYGKRPNIRSAILDQSFRLDEKEKYKSLLARAASSSFMQATFSKYNNPTSKLFRYGTYAGRGKKLVEMARTKNTPSIIDLTLNNGNGKVKLSTKATIQKVLSDFDNEVITLKDSDSDIIEVLPTPPSPRPDFKVQPVNSLKKVINTSEHCQKDWLERRVQRSKEEVANYKRQIEAQTKTRNQLGEVSAEVYTQRLEDRVRDCLHIKETVLPVHVEESFPELSEEDEAAIDRALHRRGNPNEVVAQKFNLNITRRDIQTLGGLNWLNDEVINFYMNLIIERGKNSKWPKAYAMNTFFYPKLQKDGASSLKRWTRRIDVFSYDLIAVPIHLGVHWCMAIIDFRSNAIRYYDSMGSSNRECLAALLNYLQVEHLDKKKSEYDTSDWSLESVHDIPQQMNGSDCGMFSCAFAECLTRTSSINFSQENMPYLRRKMVLEIISGELLIQ